MNVRTPDPCIYSLTGYPGTGKFTIAKELVRQLLALGHEARLVDNHTVSDPILRLVPIRDDTPVPVEVWDRVREVGRAVRTTIATISPPDWSFVFTNFVNHTPEDAAHYDALADLAEARNCRFVPVRLTVEVDELLRRTVQPERAARNKVTNPDFARAHYLRHPLFRPAYEQLLELDVTHLPPDVASARIIEHATGL